DLVLVHPGSRVQVYQSLGSALSAIEPPVWASLMATFVRRRGFSVEGLDSGVDELPPHEEAARIDDSNPLFIAGALYGPQPSAYSQNMPAAGAICSSIKERASDRKVLLVGGHVAALPERTLREEDTDFVCTGEGPVTVLELVEALKGRQTELSAVRGLC